jgi:plastocyanin
MALAVAGGCVPPGSARPAGTPAIELTVSSAAGDALAFVPDSIAAPAGTSVRITFRNMSSQSHNLTFHAPISVGSRTIVDAGASDALVLLTPGPGRYPFVCTIHMDMSGTLVVE